MTMQIGNAWIKSSFSNGSGGNNCVEVCWQTSGQCADGACVQVGFQRASGCGTSTCVEVDRGDGTQILVRDSKDKEGPALAFTRDEWLAFVAGVKAGEFDVE